MRYMNEWDIDRAEARYAGHPILEPAVRTLRSLVDWTNRNSDGWAYWPKPCRAAAKLMEMIERDGTNRYFDDSERADVTVAEYRAALRPIKAFRTRQKADFFIDTLEAKESTTTNDDANLMLVCRLLIAGREVSAIRDACEEAGLFEMTAQDLDLAGDYIDTVIGNLAPDEDLVNAAVAIVDKAEAEAEVPV